MKFVFAGIFALAWFAGPAFAQQADAAVVPDAPLPQAEVAMAAEAPTGQNTQNPPSQTSAGGNAQSTQQATQQSTQQATQQATQPATPQTGSSSSQAGQPGNEETQHQKAEEQIRQEEKQRVLGIVPTFNTTYINNAVSMTAGEKMSLAFRSTIDPFAFGAAFLVAGYHEALDDDPGFGWGAEGYFKRSGAAYLDAFDGTMIGNGILPAVLHQDPRYFRLGHGSTTHRLLYSLATNVICKHDNTGKWEPNYSNVGGNIIAGAISNLYYPSQNSGWGQTITNGMIVTAEGGFGSIFQEFWPDISRKVLHRDPTHGLDAQAAEQDREQQQNAAAIQK
jgi:hypothetical protein